MDYDKDQQKRFNKIQFWMKDFLPWRIRSVKDWNKLPSEIVAFPTGWGGGGGGYFLIRG